MYSHWYLWGPPIALILCMLLCNVQWSMSHLFMPTRLKMKRTTHLSSYITPSCQAKWGTTKKICTIHHCKRTAMGHKTQLYLCSKQTSTKYRGLQINIYEWNSAHWPVEPNKSCTLHKGNTTLMSEECIVLCIAMPKAESL